LIWSGLSFTLLNFSRQETDRESDSPDETVEQPFVAALFKEANKTLTENGAVTFKKTGDPRVDFFFTVMEQTETVTVRQCLEESWSASSLDTLKLIAQLRDIKFGKAVRAQYFASLYWLYQHHPRTLYQNLSLLLEYGCWKDLLQLLMVIQFNGHVPTYLIKEATTSDNSKNLSALKKTGIRKAIKVRKYAFTDPFNELVLDHYRKELVVKEYEELQAMIDKNETKKYKFSLNQKIPEEELFNYKGVSKREAVENSGYCNSRLPFKRDRTTDLTLVLKHIKKALDTESVVPCYDAELGRGANKERSSDNVPITMVNRYANEIDPKLMERLRLRYARERFANDVKYRYFHLAIADMFAKQLIQDANKMAEGDKNVTLAAKWAPSLDCHFDRYTLIATSIALKIAYLSRDSNKGAEQVFDRSVSVGVYLARKLYNKEYLIRLRASLQTPERYMCSRQWSSLLYHRVPSKCMQKNRTSFFLHDKTRFEEFLTNSRSISGECLKPNDFVNRAKKIFLLSAESEERKMEEMLLEKQWESLKSKIMRCGFSNLLKSCISICDVSGSMSGVPMNAAIALTLMTMEMSVEPWDKVCITFSEEPMVARIKADSTLLQKVEQMLLLDWGSNTDLMKVFELVLSIGISNQLSRQDMPSFLFIYSDMQFDEASPNQTNFEAAKKMFADAGFTLPRVVFWNLRASKEVVPVEMNEDGVLLLSGFGANQLSMIMSLQDIDEVNPSIFVENVLVDTRYEKLTVID
jgi:hypothetical protein